MSPEARSQYLAGVIALGNYLMAAPWPTDMQHTVQYIAGAVIAMLTGWHAPSATDVLRQKMAAKKPVNKMPKKSTARVAAFDNLPHLDRGKRE